MVEMSASSTTPRPTRLRHVSTGLQLVGRFAHLDIAIAEFAREFVRAQETGEEVVRAEIRCHARTITEYCVAPRAAPRMHRLRSADDR